ncbi:MAG: YaiI/YqxD family protein [Clostridia bacterium]|nr:YaiI/YqxD family protein [Clostridia bacterium]
MKIIIDADACPVVDITVNTAKARRLECIIVCDNAHTIERDGAVTIVVDKGADSADCRIANITEKGDVVVTQDYGLAALVLGKGGKALNQNGLIYTDSNIENLLFTRYIGKKEHMAGNRIKGPKKRTSQNDVDFFKALLICLDHCDGILI